LEFLFQELNVSIVSDESAKSPEYSDYDTGAPTDLPIIIAEAPKYRLYPNNSLLVSSLELDDVREYKCLVNYFFSR